MASTEYTDSTLTFYYYLNIDGTTATISGLASPPTDRITVPSEPVEIYLVGTSQTTRKKVYVFVGRYIISGISYGGFAVPPSGRALQPANQTTTTIIINIPTSISSSSFSINGESFVGCSALQRITINSSDGYYYTDRYGVLYSTGVAPSGDTLVFVPPILNANYTIPENVTIIGDQAFRSNTTITSFTIPANVTIIGQYCFYLCPALTSLTIEGVISSFNGGALANICTILPNGNLKGELASLTFNSTSDTAPTFPNSPSIPPFADSLAPNAQIQFTGLASDNYNSSISKQISNDTTTSYTVSYVISTNSSGVQYLAPKV